VSNHFLPYIINFNVILINHFLPENYPYGTPKALLPRREPIAATAAVTSTSGGGGGGNGSVGGKH